MSKNSEYDGGKPEVEQPEEDYMICSKCGGYMPMTDSMELDEHPRTNETGQWIQEIYTCEICGFMEVMLL